MYRDPIVDEVRAARQAHAASFGFDLAAMYADLKRQEHESGRTFVSYPPRSAPQLSTVPSPSRTEAK
jgi:hypothetical protein